MTEGIVARPTELGTAGSVIVGIAGDTEIVLQRRVLRLRLVGLPLGGHLEYLLHQQPLDKLICNEARERDWDHD